MKKKKCCGFTLLEVIISMGATILIIFSATNILSYVSTNNARSIAKQELFFHANIAMDFIETHINEAHRINIITEPNNTLTRMYLQNEQIRTISFRPITPPTNRIMFGGIVYGFGHQEISRYISDITVYKSLITKTLHVTITTESEISNINAKVPQIIIYRVFDIRGKIG